MTNKVSDCMCSTCPSFGSCSFLAIGKPCGVKSGEENCPHEVSTRIYCARCHSVTYGPSPDPESRLLSDEDSIFYCDKRQKCTWKCFALSSQGFSIGKLTSALPAWVEAHERECGGKLIQAVIKELP